MASRVPTSSGRVRPAGSSRAAVANGAKPTSAQRFARRQQEFRRARRRQVALIIGITALSVSLAAALTIGPVFVIRTIKIRGATPAIAEQFLARAKPVTGTPLATFSGQALRADLGRPIDVKSVDIQRQWPSTLRLTVTMRSPVAALPTSGGFRLVDETGQEFATVKSAPRGIPQVTAVLGPRGWAAVAAAVKVFDSLPPSLQSSVRNLKARSEDDIQFTWGSSVIRWGSPERSSTKLAVLMALRPQRAREYDVSAPETPVVR